MKEDQIGLVLRAWRLEEQINQTELADRAGTSQRCISRLENGTGFTFPNVNRVLTALGKSWDDLVLQVKRLPSSSWQRGPSRRSRRAASPRRA